MLILSWGTWPDCVVDFGRELYVPWQISEGQVLYRDIVSYFNGPFSPYLHAFLFKLFGVSLRTLVAFNLIVVTALAVILYRLIKESSGELAATTCGVIFFTLFAFAQYSTTGNYNYVCPYSYELTHGVVLSAAAIACMAQWHSSNRCGWLAAAGAVLGLVFLTKAEAFLAATFALSAGLCAGLWVKRSSRREVIAQSGLFVSCALAPVLLSFVLFLPVLSPGDAIRAFAGSWKWMGSRALLNLSYFRAMAGSDDLGASLASIARWTCGYVFVLGLPAIAALRLRHREGRGLLEVIVFIVLLSAGLLAPLDIEWTQIIRPIPLILAGALVIIARALVRRRPDRILRLMLLVWSLALLAKMPLNARISHYGFALAMPATLMGIAILLGWLPQWIDSREGRGGVLRAAMAAVLAVAVIHCLRQECQFWASKTVIVGTGGDAFYADERGQIINAALAQLSLDAPRGATLAVVPEGLIVNYLSRRTNPTGQLNFTPPAIVMYGEDEMLRAFQNHPPDYMLLTGVDTAEYGARYFGFDYARRLGAWIGENYVIVETIGPRPFRDPGFGVVLLRKK